MNALTVQAKHLQVGDFILTRLEDYQGNLVGPPAAERVIAVGINFTYATVDVRTLLNGHCRAAMGMPMRTQISICRPQNTLE